MYPIQNGLVLIFAMYYYKIKCCFENQLCTTTESMEMHNSVLQKVYVCSVHSSNLINDKDNSNTGFYSCPQNCFMDISHAFVLVPSNIGKLAPSTSALPNTLVKIFNILKGNCSSRSDKLQKIPCGALA